MQADPEVGADAQLVDEGFQEIDHGDVEEEEEEEEETTFVMDDRPPVSDCDETFSADGDYDLETCCGRTALAKQARQALPKRWWEAARPKGAGLKPPLQAGARLTFPRIFPSWLKARGIEHLLQLENDGSDAAHGNRRWLRYDYRGKQMIEGVDDTWELAFHGTWWYALWPILQSGIMLESNDKALGHDFWEPGVYCTPNMKTALWYARPHIVFGDGVYQRAVLELRVDPSRQKRSRKRGGTQWVFPQDAVALVGLRIQTNAPPKNGEERLLTWEPELEAVPPGARRPEPIFNDEPHAELRGEVVSEDETDIYAYTTAKEPKRKRDDSEEGFGEAPNAEELLRREKRALANLGRMDDPLPPLAPLRPLERPPPNYGNYRGSVGKLLQTEHTLDEPMPPHGGDAFSKRRRTSFIPANGYNAPQASDEHSRIAPPVPKICPALPPGVVKKNNDDKQKLYADAGVDWSKQEYEQRLLAKRQELMKVLDSPQEILEKKAQVEEKKAQVEEKKAQVEAKRKEEEERKQKEEAVKRKEQLERRKAEALKAAEEIEERTRQTPSEPEKAKSETVIAPGVAAVAAPAVVPQQDIDKEMQSFMGELGGIAPMVQDSSNSAFGKETWGQIEEAKRAVQMQQQQTKLHTQQPKASQQPSLAMRKPWTTQIETRPAALPAAFCKSSSHVVQQHAFQGLTTSQWVPQQCSPMGTMGFPPNVPPPPPGMGAAQGQLPPPGLKPELDAKVNDFLLRKSQQLAAPGVDPAFGHAYAKGNSAPVPGALVKAGAPGGVQSPYGVQPHVVPPMSNGSLGRIM